MHLVGVPVAVIVGVDRPHKDASLTMRLYAHSQDDALKAAGETLGSSCVTLVSLRTGFEDLRTVFSIRYFHR